jgi:hypothetical protein
MIKLTVDPVVLERLSQAFPKANSANKALDKYVRLITQLIRNSRSHKTDNFNKLLNLYTIPVNTLQQEGPRIGSKSQKIRLHKWLEENDLALVEKVIEGNNITHRLSQVRLTHLVQLEVCIASKQICQNMPLNALQEIIITTHPMTTTDLHDYYPDYQSDPDSYDHVIVDSTSLTNYIHWLKFTSRMIDEESRAKQVEDCEFILKVANINAGLYPMKYNPSAYGRTYYKHINIQSVPKLMRGAILGECWEYDVRSSVIGWKTAWIERLSKQHMDTSEFRKTFSATLNYLEDKRDFMATVYRDMFSHFEDGSAIEANMKLIKQAITAISFGARATAVCWEFTINGFSKRTAISGIFKCHELAKKFLENPTVSKFKEEQNLMDACIVETIKQDCPAITKNPLFKNAKRFNKAKLMAYLYQQEESRNMQIAVDIVRAFGQEPLARIHDAFIVRDKIGFERKHELELLMQDETGNRFWRLGETHIDGFAKHVKSEVDEKRSSDLSCTSTDEEMREATFA